MSTETVIKELERTIKRVSVDIRKKKGSVGSDKLDSLSKLINSYTRLIERSKDEDGTNNICYAEILKQSVK